VKLHRLYGLCYGESWAATTFCGLKVLRGSTTQIDSEVNCKNCLRALEAYRKENK